MSIVDKKKLILIAAIVLVVVLIGASVAVAAYLMTSNTKPVVVTPQATLTLTTSADTLVLGSTVTLTATCSDTSYTGDVTFYANGSPVATVAAVAGVASYVWTPASASTFNIVATGTHT